MTKENKLAVLFDMDGVLVDSEPALGIIAAEVFQEINIPAKPEDFTPYIGTGEDTYLGEVMEKYGIEYDPEIKHDVYSAYVKEAVKYVKTFPGSLELLNYLENLQIKMAVASSADQIKVHANIEALGFNNFHAVITGSDVKRKKPFPDIYLLAAEAIEAEPKNCIVVEDATAGIASGNAAGMTTVGFTSSVNREKMLVAGADYIVDDFYQLKELINNLLDNTHQ